MKRILTILSLVATLSSGTMVAAAASCSISNTGNNSNNSCTHSGSSTVTYTCVNGVLINTQTNQAANSGNATTSGNTGGGSATSGNALNNGATTTNVNSTCAAASTTGNNPGGRGGSGIPGNGSSSGGQTLGRSSGNGVSVLPDTGATTPALLSSIVVSALAGLTIVAKLGISTYRRSVL